MSTPVAIYKIVNILDGKMYIGQSVNPEYRAKRHFWKNNGCIKLRNAIEKHGRDAFKFSVLCWCANKTEANDAEGLVIEMVDSCKSGYNITPGGYGTGSGAANPFFGKSHTNETRLKLSILRAGKPMAEATKQKIAKANTARKMSEETKAKLRARPTSAYCSEQTAKSNKERVWTEASKEKLAAHNRGRKMSDETKAKIAAANRARVWTPESRAKLAASRTKMA